AESVWPKEQRTVFCWSSRSSNGEKGDCKAKDGNPFGPFWNRFGIDFVSSEFFGSQGLNYDVSRGSAMAKRWNEVYPKEKYAGIAFTGAPASFPVEERNRALHRHLRWNDRVLKEAEEFIGANMPDGVFVGIHLRNDLDWVF